ncbi:hypothetical protein V6N13_106036 [Hibiscus sabdariffa]
MTTTRTGIPRKPPVPKINPKPHNLYFHLKKNKTSWKCPSSPNVPPQFPGSIYSNSLPSLQSVLQTQNDTQRLENDDDERG